VKKIEATIVLVRPQLPENIGLVARAMQNNGLNKLVIISPREKWPNQKALKSSSNAKKIIQNAKVFNSLEKGIEKYQLVIATSARKRFLFNKYYHDFDLLFSNIPNVTNIAILFGPENSGLTNKDMNLCDFIFTIPTSNKNTSLNLSHAVLIFAYKWKEFYSKNKIKKNDINENISNKKNLLKFLNFLKIELKKSGYLFPIQKSDSIFQNIQSIFMKAKLSPKEIQSLWGALKSIAKPRKR
tara:strand:+ start:17118 stop:17840 length:723 start_codon:yes stop_codon:yes gene_type:complete